MVIWSGTDSNFKPSVLKKKYYVYAIHLHQNEIPIYIGKGTQGRAKSHGRKNSKSSVGKVLKNKEEYWISILSESDDESAIYQLEKYFISKFGKKLDGGYLLNIEDGGPYGGSMYRHVELKANKSKEYSRRFGKSCHFAGFVFPSKRVAFNVMKKNRAAATYYESIGYFFEIQEGWQDKEEKYLKRLDSEVSKYRHNLEAYLVRDHGKRKPVVYMGKIYDSLTLAALENDKTSAAISWWLNHPDKIDCFYLEDNE